MRKAVERLLFLCAYFFVRLLFLGAGMRGVIDALDLLEGGMRIDLGSTERRMSEQFLNSSDVGTVVEHGCSESMAQHMRGVFLERADFAHPFADDGI